MYHEMKSEAYLNPLSLNSYHDTRKSMKSMTSISA